MENQNNTQKYRILLMGQYKSLFIKGAFPSLKKKKDNEYQKVIHYDDNLIEISITEIDDPYSMELDELRNDNQKNDILALFAIDGTDETFLVETDSIIEELKNRYQNSDLRIKDYILLGIIPKNYNNDLLDSNNLSLFTLHKIAEKQNCFCYEMEESEEEIDYNIFLLNYAMFSWIEFDKMYSNEELMEMIEKNTGYENKDIKLKVHSKNRNNYNSSIEMKVISDQKKEKADSKNKEKKKEKNKEKEKEKKELSNSKLLKLKIKEEIKKLFEAIKIKNSNKINGSEDIKDKKYFLNFLNLYPHENKENKKEIKDKLKDRLIRIYKMDNLEIFRCIYCHDIPEIKIINDKYVEIKCNNYRDENHIGKRNLLTIKQFLDINFNLRDKNNQISYAKCKCIYCDKNHNDIIKETATFINTYQNDTKNLSINEIKNDFFYYFNENKIFFCNICKSIVCQKCKKYHKIYCNLDNENIDNIDNNVVTNEINYESYKEIKNLIEEKLVDYESEIKLNKQFMPLYMYDAYCPKHKKPFNYYCENCRLNLCNECLNHNNHNILNWMDIDSLWILKQEEITREKNEINNISKKVNDLINKLSSHLNNLIQNLKDIICFKEKILINSKYINNNYNIYTNLKNIQFNFKIFDEEKYEKENNIMKKLCILCEYLNKPYSIMNHNIFNENIEDKIYKNVSLVNKNIINNNNKSDITSLIIFDKNKLINNPYNNSSNENNNVFAYSTNNGDVSFYKSEKNGIFSKICTFYLFEKNQGIFDLKKIKHNLILCGGFEQLKIISVKLVEKKYDIIKIINKSNSSFVRNWALTNNIILSYFPNKKELNLIKYTKNDLENNCISWLLLNKNNNKNKDIDFIINNQFVLISLIKLKNEKYKNRFVISLSNNEKQDENEISIKYKDCLLFYNIKDINNDNIENNINLEKIMHIPSIEKSEYNLFEISYSNLLVCKLDFCIENFAIINTSNYTIEKIIQLANSELIKNYSFFNSTFFMKHKSLYLKNDYYLSINKDLNLIQWYFNKDTIKFIPIDNLPLKFIKEDFNFRGSKNKVIKQLLFFPDNNCLIALTNDNFIFNIFLES